MFLRLWNSIHPDAYGNWVEAEAKRRPRRGGQREKVSRIGVYFGRVSRMDTVAGKICENQVNGDG